MMADVLLVVHFLIAAFIVGGLLLVWIGAALGWRWVRHFLYYQAPEWVFTAAYVGWTLATLLTLWRWPPRRFNRKAP